MQTVIWRRLKTFTQNNNKKSRCALWKRHRFHDQVINVGFPGAVRATCHPSCSSYCDASTRIQRRLFIYIVTAVASCEVPVWFGSSVRAIAFIISVLRMAEQSLNVICSINRRRLVLSKKKSTRNFHNNCVLVLILRCYFGRGDHLLFKCVSYNRRCIM